MNSAVTIAVTSVFALALPAAAVAQPAKASRSAQDIVCELTGDCAAAATDADRIELPEEAAFSFTRPGAVKASTAPARAAQPAVARTTARPMPTRVASARLPRAAAMAAAPVRAPAAGGIDMRITFGLGSAEMTPQGRAEAEAFAKALQLPGLAAKRFVVEGHTDASGNRDTNVRLSQARAESVTAYLRSLGVTSDRLTARGYGPDKPLPGRSAAAPANRRVQFVPVS